MTHKNAAKQKRLGWIAGFAVGIFGRKPRAYSNAELHQKDFQPDTQKMGLRFTDRIRNTFRHHWIRLKKHKS